MLRARRDPLPRGPAFCSPWKQCTRSPRCGSCGSLSIHACCLRFATSYSVSVYYDRTPLIGPAFSGTQHVTRAPDSRPTWTVKTAGDTRNGNWLRSCSVITICSQFHLCIPCAAAVGAPQTAAANAAPAVAPAKAAPPAVTGSVATIHRHASALSSQQLYVLYRWRCCWWHIAMLVAHDT